MQEGKKGLNAVNVKLAARMSSAHQVKKVTVRGWNPTQKTSFAILLGGGGSGGCSDAARVYFNPKELTVDKPVAWKLKKEEGGRHTPFHNKYRPQFYSRTTDVTGEIDLPEGRGMEGVNPFYEESGQSGQNPLFEGAKFGGDNTPIVRGSALGGLQGRLYGPGQAHWGSAKLEPQTYKAKQGKSGKASIAR